MPFSTTGSIPILYKKSATEPTVLIFPNLTLKLHPMQKHGVRGWLFCYENWMKSVEICGSSGTIGSVKRKYRPPPTQNPRHGRSPPTFFASSNKAAKALYLPLYFNRELGSLISLRIFPATTYTVTSLPSSVVILALMQAFPLLVKPYKKSFNKAPKSLYH